MKRAIATLTTLSILALPASAQAFCFLQDFYSDPNRRLEARFEYLECLIDEQANQIADLERFIVRMKQEQDANLQKSE